MIYSVPIVIVKLNVERWLNGKAPGCNPAECNSIGGSNPSCPTIEVPMFVTVNFFDPLTYQRKSWKLDSFNRHQTLTPGHRAILKEFVEKLLEEDKRVVFEAFAAHFKSRGK